MSPMLDVSAEVRAEIGAEEADRLLAGQSAPGSYDCTSCHAPGNTAQDPTSTVLFRGDETAVLAFAHAACTPSQVISVSEEQVRGAVRAINEQGSGAAPEHASPVHASPEQQPAGPEEVASDPRHAVLGVTCGQVLVEDQLHPALVVEPTSPIARPGSDGAGDDFLPLLTEQGFRPVSEIAEPPRTVSGWSVLLATGELHAILQPGPDGRRPTAWWQAHRPLAVTDGWRTAANKTRTVFVYAAPAGSIGKQPREDLLRKALEDAAARGVLVAAAMPLAGT